MDSVKKWLYIRKFGSVYRRWGFALVVAPVYFNGVIAGDSQAQIDFQYIEADQAEKLKKRFGIR